MNQCIQHFLQGQIKRVRAGGGVDVPHPAAGAARIPGQEKACPGAVGVDDDETLLVGLCVQAAEIGHHRAGHRVLGTVRGGPVRTASA